MSLLDKYKRKVEGGRWQPVTVTAEFSGSRFTCYTCPNEGQVRKYQEVAELETEAGAVNVTAPAAGYFCHIAGISKADPMKAGQIIGYIYLGGEAPTAAIRKKEIPPIAPRDRLERARRVGAPWGAAVVERQQQEQQESQGAGGVASLQALLFEVEQAEIEQNGWWGGGTKDVPRVGPQGSQGGADSVGFSFHDPDDLLSIILHASQEPQEADTIKNSDHLRKTKRRGHLLPGYHLELLGDAAVDISALLKQGGAQTTNKSEIVRAILEWGLHLPAPMLLALIKANREREGQRGYGFGG